MELDDNKQQQASSPYDDWEDMEFEEKVQKQLVQKYIDVYFVSKKLFTQSLIYIFQKHYEDEHKFDFSGTIGIEEISKSLRHRTTEQCKQIRDYQLPPFIQQLRNSKRANCLRNIQKTDKEETSYFYEFPSFAMFQYAADDKCSSCKSSWRPTEKKSLGTDTNKYHPIPHCNVKTIHHKIDTNDTFFCLMVDADWNDHSFDEFYKRDKELDPDMSQSQALFSRLMDNYNHATASNSSAFGTFLPNAAKAKVCILYDNT